MAGGLEGLLTFLGPYLGDAALGGADAVKMRAISQGLGVVEGLIGKISDKVKINAEDFTLLGSIKYWDGILGKMKDTNAALGIAGNLGVNLQSSFRGAYASVVEMGISDEKLAKSVQTYLTNSGRAQILSANQMAELAKMTDVLGEESMEIVTTYGRMGLGIEASTKRMRNLIVESNKFGVLPTKVSGILKSNIEAVNKYHFKNGVKALEQMAIYAAKTNTDMSGAFAMADKILEGGIEGTMEMSTDLQLLGGSFGNLPNMSELIYLARNDVGKFNEILSGAAADLVDFNEETGEFDYGSEGMQRLRQAAKVTGADLSKLVEGGKALKKSVMIGDELDSSLKGLKNYDELRTKVSGAAFKNDSGDWVVKMKKDGKEIEQAVSALTEDQIKQISFTDESKGPEAAFENIAKSNEKLDDTLNRLISTLKVEALSTAGYEQFNKIATTAADNIKEIAKPFIDTIKTINEGAVKNLVNVLDPASKGDYSGAAKAAGENLADAGGMLWGVTKDVGQMLYNVFTNAAKYLAAGIEWGFRNSLGILQEGIIWAYNNTFGLIPGMGISKAKPEDTRVSFQEVLKGYNIKGVLEDTTIREDFYKMLGVNTTQSNTTPNVENKAVPEVKKVPDDKSISKSSTETNVSGNVIHSGTVELNLKGQPLGTISIKDVNNAVQETFTGNTNKEVSDILKK